MAFSEAEDDEFFPSNNELVDRFLRAKLDGRFRDLGADAAYFLDADVCSARPEELVRAHSIPARVSSKDAADGQQFYFFSPARFVGTKVKTRRSRTIDGTGDTECWHAEGRPKPIDDSVAGGYVTKFSYHVRTGHNKIVEKPGWIMAEYTFKDTSDGDMVLCKIYKSPRGPWCSKSKSRSSGRKRKVADDLEETVTSRRPRRQRQTEDDEHEEEEAMPFASSTPPRRTEEDQEDRGVMPFPWEWYVDQDAPEQQLVPVFGEFMSLMMAKDEDLFVDYQLQQDVGIQTELTAYDVIAVLAPWFIPDDEFLLDGSPMSCPHPGGGAFDVSCT